jgi:hypothetical protein
MHQRIFVWNTKYGTVAYCTDSGMDFEAPFSEGNHFVLFKLIRKLANFHKIRHGRQGSFPDKGSNGIFLFANASRPALRPT